METILADLRQAIRVLRISPGFTLVAALALALGIGANTAIFSVVNAVLLKPLPYPQSDRILRIARHFKEGNGNSASIPKFMAWRQARVFDSVAAYDFAGPGMNLGSGDRPSQVKAIHVSQQYFRVFGTNPIAGRAFSEQEDRPGLQLHRTTIQVMDLAREAAA